MKDGHSATATLVSILAVLVALALFCVLLTAFLLVPFFVFIVAIVALLVSELNRRGRSDAAAKPTGAGQ